jgi:DNA-binding SARP family transcriptional activator
VIGAEVHAHGGQSASHQNAGVQRAKLRLLSAVLPLSREYGVVMRVDVLGPLAVMCGPKRATIPGPRLQAVLGVLALRAGQVVSVSEPIDAAWPPGAVPATAVKTVRSHVAHLRQTLRGHRHGETLQPGHPGYLLALPATAVDRFRFEQAAAAGRALRDGGEHGAAVAQFRAALAHWRGEVLAGCDLHGWAAADATRLAEARLVVTEDKVAAELAAGQHREVVAELEYLVRRHPFRERFWELLMLALHTTGRQADALAA